MVRMKKRDIKKMLKNGAKAGGVSYADIKADIQAKIEEEMYSTDPDVRENFQRLFGSKKPTPEEYILALTKRMKF